MPKRVIKIKSAILQEKIQAIGKCENCGRTENLTLDHIIPEQFLLSIGLSAEDCLMDKYLQLYCRKCNTFKGNRIDFANPKTKPLLLELINTL